MLSPCAGQARFHQLRGRRAQDHLAVVRDVIRVSVADNHLLGPILRLVRVKP
jgi:hypothetical protein